jgi:AAA domain
MADDGLVGRHVVLVSGAPGAGKSTLASELCSALKMPLLSKDVIKESIWDALGPPEGDLEWSRRIGGVAMEVLWTIAEHSPRVVLEANFRPHSSYERKRTRGTSRPCRRGLLLVPPGRSECVATPTAQGTHPTMLRMWSLSLPQNFWPNLIGQSVWALSFGSIRHFPRTSGSWRERSNPSFPPFLLPSLSGGVARSILSGCRPRPGRRGRTQLSRFGQAGLGRSPAAGSGERMPEPGRRPSVPGSRRTPVRMPVRP